MINQIAADLQLAAPAVQAVVSMLADGNTVPFIARYRKEKTNHLDEVQIRAIQERHQYLTELQQRKETIMASIASTGNLTPALQAQLLACNNKTVLEDLYLPFKPKKRTRASVARSLGLEPLAQIILAQPLDGEPLQEAQAYVKDTIESPQQALQGARDIIADMVAEHPTLRQMARELIFKNGLFCATAIASKDVEHSKYAVYSDFQEAIKTIPSHRFLAIRRGEKEGFLRSHIMIDTLPIISHMQTLFKYHVASPYAAQLSLALDDCYERLLLPSISSDVRIDMKMRADKEAIDVFASNLRHLLLASPLGSKAVIGIDPGLRTGCKCVALQPTGAYLGTTTFYLHGKERGIAQAEEILQQFIGKYNAMYPELYIAIGNGTGSREAEAFVRAWLKKQALHMTVVTVNEAGASVYSASDTAREEFADLDITVRGAISIGRRLQDPLAELVKIDPKAIGVGQYQHDVHQPSLQKQLDDVVESCVNHVGVELNTASEALLARVAGIGPSLAQRLVLHRTQHGAYQSREALKEVPGVGPRTFEQAAGFLRIRDSKQPLDSSAIHPESYPVVERMLNDLHVSADALFNNTQLIDQIDIKRYTSPDLGEWALQDILLELKKPGRDPRTAFEPPHFRDDIATMQDLQPGMVLEGIVTNVTAFGAFVDIGVHQDGLVHISHLMCDVHVGCSLQVKVLEIDIPRKRISLSTRLSPDKPAHAPINVIDKKAAKQKNKAPTGAFKNNPFSKLRS